MLGQCSPSLVSLSDRQSHSLTHRKKPADALIIKNPYNMVERLADRAGERPGYIIVFVAVKSLCVTQQWNPVL